MTLRFSEMKTGSESLDMPIHDFFLNKIYNFFFKQTQIMMQQKINYNKSYYLTFKNKKFQKSDK